MDKKQLTGIFAGIGYFLLYACLMMVFQMLYTFVIMGISYIGGTRKEMDFGLFANNNLLTTVLLTIVSVGVIFYLIFKRRGKSVKIEWKLLPFTSKALVISVTAAVAYSMIYSLLANYISPEGTNPIFRSANYYSGIAPGLGVFLILLNLLVAAPVVEEIVMRGVVYTRIENAVGSKSAIIISSLLFGMMHVSAGGLILAIGAVLMGLVFALIFAKTNSLWVCIVAHSFANIPDLLLYLINI